MAQGESPTVQVETSCACRRIPPSLIGSPLGKLQCELLGAGQGWCLLGLLLLHLGEDRERQEHLVARSVGRRQLPLGERSQVTVHLRFELGLIREPVRQHLPRLFERLAEVEHLLKLRASVGQRRRIFLATQSAAGR